jgi:hypothetical protein
MLGVDMEKNLNRNWWVLFCLWIAVATIAIAYPLLKERDLGTLFELIALSLFASIFGFPVLIITITNWRKLRILQRCLGVLPAIYLVAPIAMFAR